MSSPSLEHIDYEVCVSTTAGDDNAARKALPSSSQLFVCGRVERVVRFNRATAGIVVTIPLHVLCRSPGVYDTRHSVPVTITARSLTSVNALVRPIALDASSSYIHVVHQQQ